MDILEITMGTCYSNGAFGHSWFVWQVTDIRVQQDGIKADDLIRYKVLAGKSRRKSFECSREDFARQVQYQVELNENSWRRVSGD
jgi:hypothetical protein